MRLHAIARSRPLALDLPFPLLMNNQPPTDFWYSLWQIFTVIWGS
jgi:hypothetical protein